MRLKSLLYYLIVLWLLIVLAACTNEVDRGGPNPETLIPSSEVATDYNENGLRRLPKDELHQRMRSGTFNYVYAKFLGRNGAPLTALEKDSLNRGEYGLTYYTDRDGVIREVRIKTQELEDQYTEILRRGMSGDGPFYGITTVEIDCDKVTEIMNKVEADDQAVRTAGSGNMATVDSINQNIVVSLIQKCGLQADYVQDVWIVLQHSNSALVAYYLPELRKFAAAGSLRPSSLALMEDRLRLWNGFPQIYGSQISNGELYDLLEPEKVDERRSSVGLGPLSEYVARFNLDYATEMARMGVEIE